MYWNAIYWDDYFIINSAGANIANMTNSYDLASRITSEILNGGAPTTYQYDVVDELTSDAVVSYSYDLNGNFTNMRN